MKKLNTEEFIKKATLIHGNVYIYKNVEYKRWNVNVEIICPIHGSFLQLPNNHLRGRKCPNCSKKLRIYNSKKTIKQFVEESNKVHNNYYNYSITKYSSFHEKVDIICPIHGIFKQTPAKHLNGKGCSKCNGGVKKDLSEFIEESNKIHNFKYDYSNTKYINNKKKVEIFCKIHGSFFQIPSNHLKGYGCPKCKISKGENRIINFLEKNKINYIFEYKYKDCINPKTKRKLSFDFYLPNHNICIEYDGQQHYMPVSFSGTKENLEDKFKENIFRDGIKNNYCIDNNIKLIRIGYEDYDNIENILENNFKN